MIIARGIDSLRLMLFSFMNSTIAYFFMKQMLEKKRQGYPVVYIMFITVKDLFVTWFCVSIEYDYIQENPWLWISYNVVIFMQGILLAGVLCFTFKGTWIKIIIVSMFAEVLACVAGYIGVILVNLLEGSVREFYKGQLKLMDVLVPVIAFFIYYMICKVAKPLFDRVKKYELKHLKFWGVVGVICWLSGVQSHRIREIHGDYLYWQQMSFMIVEVIMLVAASGIYVYSFWKSQTIRKHQYLEKQKELMGMYMKAIQRQILWMKQAEKEMNRQMKEILSIDCEEEKNQKFATYLEQLKKQYQTIKAGIYCGDGVVDSILFYFSQRFDKKGIPFSFSFQQYESGILASEDAGELIFQLLNLVSAGSVELKTQVVGNALFFEFQCDTVKKKRVKNAALSVIEKYSGEVWQDRTDRGGRYLITIRK